MFNRKMKYRNKNFYSIFLDNYLSCLDKNENQELVRELNKNVTFKNNFKNLLFNFYFAHEALLQSGYYMTDSLDLFEINPDNIDKIYSVYIYENLLIDSMLDCGIEQLNTTMNKEDLINWLQDFSQNTISFQPF